MKNQNSDIKNVTEKTTNWLLPDEKLLSKQSKMGKSKIKIKINAQM